MDCIKTEPDPDAEVLSASCRVIQLVDTEQEEQLVSISFPPAENGNDTETESRAAILDNNVLPSSSNSDECTVPKKMVSVDDYGIDSSYESSDNEDKPNRPIPLWAHKAERLEALKKQALVPDELTEAFFACEKKHQI